MKIKKEIHMPSRRTEKQYCEGCGTEIKMKNGKYNKRFCTKNCSDKFSVMEKHPSWRGGKYTCLGYVYIYMPNHPSAYSNGYMRRCRVVAEQIIGRPLTRDEYAHHINEVKDDDRVENIQIMKPREHCKLHMSKPRPERRIRKHFSTRPEEVIVGEHIHVGKHFRHVVGRECIVCNKKYWARLNPESNYCSIKCHWVKRRACV